MFKTVKELKEFILWAKREKIQALNINGVQVEFHQAALLEDVYNVQQTPDLSNESVLDQQEAAILAENKQLEDDESLLFHSSGY